jgi:DNA modification methylase
MGDEPAMAGTSAGRLEHTYRSKGHVGGLTHGLYRYPARFSPELAAAAVEAFTRPGEVVLDPFVGGGTSAVESLVRGRRFVGFDINPIAVLLTQVKTDPLAKMDLTELEKWALATNVPAPPQADDGRLRNAPAELVRLLSPLLGTAERLSSPRVRLAARALLMDVAQWAVDGRQTQVPAEALPLALAQSYERLRSGMDELAGLARANGVRRSDFARRRMLRLGAAQSIARSRPLNRLAGRVKLVVTSPPYPGVHVLYHRWQVRGRAETPMAYWLAGANDGLGPKHYTMGGRSSLGEDVYFESIRETWLSVQRLLRSDALVLQLVAFSDADTQLPRYLEAMNAAGYSRRADLEPEGWRDVPNRRWYYRVQPGRGSARERLLVHEAREL